MKCIAKSAGIVSTEGKPSLEWHKGDEPQYYFRGYMDMKTDEPIVECRICDKFVENAQDDLEAWNRRAK